MGEGESRLPDLEVLSGKVYQAKELINWLRRSNKELNSRLDGIQSRLETQEEVPPAAPELHEEPPRASTDANSKLERLRGERREIRERVSRLLEQIESLEL